MRPRKALGDILAGTSVALVLVPQALAYAELAGLPAYHGLYASALAPIAAAIFASSPYLQTGPTAVTALLTFGALSAVAAPFTASYVGLAALLALLVGLVRVSLGALRAGALAYYVSVPVVRGFTVAAAVLIGASQIPTVLGVSPQEAASVLARAGTALADPAAWSWQPGAVAAGTLMLMLGGRRLHPLFPGVLIATAAGLVIGAYADYDGAMIGSVPEGFLTFSLDLPWAEVPALLVPAAVIAVVGFAEPTAIARTYATLDRTSWDPSRELLSQGAANLAAGVVGGFPVGGSFSRSALNRLAGARTRWAGAVTGVVVLGILPFAGVLTPLPRAVLGAIVLGAVFSLLKFGPLLAIWRRSYPQASIAWLTFAATLALAPHVEYGVVIGVGASIAVHAWREMRVRVDSACDGERLVIAPKGVLWFASAQNVEDRFVACLGAHRHAKTLVLQLSGLGRVDYSGALALKSMIDSAERAGLAVELIGVPPQCERILGKLGLIDLRGPTE